MDALDALNRGINWRANLPPNHPDKNMSDADMLRIIQTKINTGRAQHRPSINYADPTGDMAVARADRSRR